MTRSNVADELPRLMLLSGLAADERIFVAQKLAFPQLSVPQWLAPFKNEPLDDYAKRLASEIGPGPCVIGGASFGGIVALHLVRHLNPEAVILIGSVRSPSELPMCARLARPLRCLTLWLPVRAMQWAMKPLLCGPLRTAMPFVHGLLSQFLQSDPAVFRWSLHQILNWKSAPACSCPIYHIHGSRDWVMPAKNTLPDKIVPGAGHVLSLTHPQEVNEFIRFVMKRTKLSCNPSSH